MAVAMVESGTLNEREALLKLDSTQILYFLEKQIDLISASSIHLVGKGRLFFN